MNLICSYSCLDNLALVFLKSLSFIYHTFVEQQGNLKYTLYGVLVHYGPSAHSGHYACFVRTSNGMWHSLDDKEVSISVLRSLGSKVFV